MEELGRIVKNQLFLIPNPIDQQLLGLGWRCFVKPVGKRQMDHLSSRF